MSRNYSNYPRDNRSRGHKSDHRGHEYHQNRHHRREPSGIRKEKQFKRSSVHRHVPATKGRYLLREDISRLAGSTSSVVSNYVNKNTFGFLAAYNYKRFHEDSDTLSHLVEILHLLTRIDDFERIAPRTIARIFDRNGEYSDFICSLNKHIKKMGTEKRIPILQRNLKSLRKLTDIGMKMLSLLPDTSVSTFPVLSIKEAVDDIRKKTTVPDGIIDDVKSMVDLYCQMHLERDVRRVCAGPSYQYIDDVHTLPPLEGLVASKSLNIQSNIIKGPYRSWKHYLDTQYQLMRGDFLIPLRDGIKSLSHHVGNQKKNESLYIYSQVKIREPVFLYAGVGFQLHFDVSKLTSINWENSKRLMFGSLLCLSKDNFHQSSVLYASVMKRDPRLLNDGFVTVKFEEDISHLQLHAEDTKH